MPEEPQNHEHFVDAEAGLTEHLVRQIQAGDRETFDRLFARYCARILQVARAKLPEHLKQYVDDEDILQEVWIKAYCNLSSFTERGHGSFQRWIMTILARSISDLVRIHAARKRGVPGKAILSIDRGGTESALVLAERIAESTASPSSKAWAHENCERVVAAVAQLPDRQREVIALRYFQGYSVAETAAKLSITEAAVKMATLRGLKELGRTFRGFTP